MIKVLIAPLDWGLGHATRCIPIIRELMARNCDVLIAGSGDSLLLLKVEFPSLTFFPLPAYHPVYPASGSMVWKMASQLPKFISVIKGEHQQIEQLIMENNIDLVISDNRYGCWSSRIISVFITHQSNILMPRRFGWLAPLVRRMSEKMIRRFSFCWIPDYPATHSLAGKLISFDKTIDTSRVMFIGNLSRFKPAPTTEIKYDIVCIFSGPEPQRSIFEKIVVSQIQQSGLKYFIVRGLLTSPNPSISDNNCVDFLDSDKLQWLIQQSACVIARSGYSTVMDLARLGKKAIFIPTPGQTEQEYLADRLKKMKIAYSESQSSFDLMKAWSESKAFTGFQVASDQTELLGESLDQVLHKALSDKKRKVISDFTTKGSHREKVS